MNRHPDSYLLDTSAYVRLRKPSVKDRLSELIDRGLVHTCYVLDLEAGRGYGAAEYRAQADNRRQALLHTAMPADCWLRAVELQRELVSRGTHQGPSVVDLLVAVCAQESGLVVMHYDRDFEAIEAVTGQRTEWVAPAGSADDANAG